MSKPIDPSRPEPARALAKTSEPQGGPAARGPTFRKTLAETPRTAASARPDPAPRPLLGDGSPESHPMRRHVAERSDGGEVDRIEERRDAPGDTGSSRAELVMDTPLEPFRVNPALHSMRPTTPDPIRQDQTASIVAAELVESMRVGRFGREGHAVSMRLRTPSGVLGVELREEDGALRMQLDGASPAELERLGARVQRALRDRGIELEVS